MALSPFASTDHPRFEYSARRTAHAAAGYAGELYGQGNELVVEFGR